MRRIKMRYSRSGAFGNKPHQVSQWYKEVLREPEFKGQFRKVVFGIIDDRNGTNFQPFFDSLNGQRI